MVNESNITSSMCGGFQTKYPFALRQFDKSDVLDYALAWTNIGLNLLLAGIAFFCNIKILNDFSNKQARKWKILLFNLVLADVFVGLVILPWRALLLGAALLNEPAACQDVSHSLFQILQRTFSTASFHAVFMVTVEKYVSVVHCMKCSAVMTKTRMLTAVLLGWTISGTLGILTLFTPRKVQLILSVHITWVCLTLSALNLKVHLVAKSQRTKIYLQRLSVRREETHPAKKYLKMHKSVSMAIAMITLCYFPQALISFIFFIEDAWSIGPLQHWSETLFLAASSLNPFVYLQQCKKSPFTRKRAIYLSANADNHEISNV